MAKRALVIRSDYNPLAGFANSAAVITEVLRARGFEIISCAGRDATRAGILCAYEALVDRARPEDAVALYYVGHGGVVTNPSYTPGGGLPPHFQHICPTDFADTTEDDFRGISAQELSLQLAALTRKTKNVTVILECCFAGQMSRGDDPPQIQHVPPKLTRVGLMAHLQWLRRRYGSDVDLAVAGNPDAVRVVATGQLESAYQVTLPPARALQALACAPPGGWIGAMTLALVQILGEIGDRRVAWRSIGEALRARLNVQRPEVEGPVSRVPFSLTTVDAVTFGVRAADDGSGAIVDAGRLLGVSIGDVYGVMPAGSTEIDPAQLIAEITIDAVASVESRARDIVWRPGMITLPPNAVAIPRTLALERYPVRVVAGTAQRPAIEAALQSSARVRPASPQDRDVLVTLQVRGDTLELRDEFGPLCSPSPCPAGLPDAVRDVENLATVRRLRAMADQRGTAPDDVSVDLLIVDSHGAYRALADHGAAVGLGDRLAVRLVNRTRAEVFAHVFSVELRGRIAMLSDPGGIQLIPGTPAYCGAASTGRLAGFQLFWPAGLPADQPRLDTAMVIITQQPADLGALETQEHLARSAAPVSPLEALIGQIARGGSRGMSDEPACSPSPFAIYWRDFELFPLGGSLDYGAPQVDASPPGAPPPRCTTATVQVGLDALVVAADTRVDVLVCGRSSSTPYRTTTLTGPAPGRVAIWSGELQGALDVYVWTSPQRGDPGTLADLLALQPTREPVALLRRPDDGVASPLAAGASKQLAALARVALRGASADVTMAFHGSFGAGDRGTRCTTPAAAFEIRLEESAGA
jgi:hypothetical protein